ncbi:MAG: hypothetical protein NWS47_02605 [Alphaproteobacteria bacterium]|nr:hypothetical protein [Alphaproteobacteria bacterium]
MQIGSKMYLFKQNFLKLDIKNVAAALILCFSSSITALANASDTLMEDCIERCKRIDEECEQKLTQASHDFDNASSTEMKFSIISQPIQIDSGNEEYTNSPYKKPHALSFGICMGKTGLVEKFLSAVTDINSEDLDVRGWRQDYTMAHLAIRPHFPQFDVCVEQRLRIIDLLANKGANFNLVRPSPSVGTYTWHPLYDHPVFSNYLKKHEDIVLLQSRALLYGGDPLKGQLDFADLEFDSKRYNDYYSKIYRIALSMYLKLEDASDVIQLTPHTIKRFNDELEKHYAKNGKDAPFIP